MAVALRDLTPRRSRGRPRKYPAPRASAVAAGVRPAAYARALALVEQHHCSAGRQEQQRERQEARVRHGALRAALRVVARASARATWTRHEWKLLLETVMQESEAAMLAALEAVPHPLAHPAVAEPLGPRALPDVPSLPRRDAVCGICGEEAHAPFRPFCAADREHASLEAVD